MAEKRPVRMCDSCGGVDDHPRHVYATVDGDGITDSRLAALAIKNAGDANFEAIVAQVQDNSTIVKHMDCCRADGCPDGSCYVVTAGAEDKRGNALVKHLTGREVEPDRRRGGVALVEDRNDPDADPDADVPADAEGGN